MAGAALETLSERRCFGGVQGFYRHASAATGEPMRIGVFVAGGGRARAARRRSTFWPA